MESLKPKKTATSPSGPVGGVKPYYPQLGIWQKKNEKFSEGFFMNLQRRFK
jgi:hypothetical protein